MTDLARFVIKRRWWVIAGWIVAIVLIQVLSSSVGAAKYKDDAKLPGTETQTVFNLLTNAHLSQQNNATGTMVLHARSGTLAAEPAGRLLAQGALRQLQTVLGAPRVRERRPDKESR